MANSSRTTTAGLLVNSKGSYFANVSLPQGTLITTFRVCGRDNDSTPGVNFSASLKRKPLVTTGRTAFNVADVLATAGSNGAATSPDLQCFTAPITFNMSAATIDNTAFWYWVEIDNPQSTLEMAAVQIDHF